MSKTGKAARRFTLDGQNFKKDEEVTGLKAGQYDDLEAAGLIAGESHKAAETSNTTSDSNSGAKVKSSK